MSYDAHQILDQLVLNLHELMKHSKFAQTDDDTNSNNPLLNLKAVSSIEPVDILTLTDISATRVGTTALTTTFELEQLLDIIQLLKLRAITNDHTNTLNTVQYQRELSHEQHCGNTAVLENVIEMLHTIIHETQEMSNTSLLNYMTMD